MSQKQHILVWFRTEMQYHKSDWSQLWRGKYLTQSFALFLFEAIRKIWCIYIDQYVTKRTWFYFSGQQTLYTHSGKMCIQEIKQHKFPFFQSISCKLSLNFLPHVSHPMAMFLLTRCHCPHLNPNQAFLVSLLSRKWNLTSEVNNTWKYLLHIHDHPICYYIQVLHKIYYMLFNNCTIY